MDVTKLSRIALMAIFLCSIALLFLVKNKEEKENVLSATNLADPISNKSLDTGSKAKADNILEQEIPSPKPISLIDIFDNIDNSNSDDENTWTLLVTGDVMLGRSVNYKTIKAKDFTWAWQNTADLFSNADYSLINLENPLVADCPIKNDGMIFCGDIDHIEGLKSSGIDGASLANNHAMNYGESGVSETKELLDTNGIDPIGIQNPTYSEIKGTKVAFLGYTDVECPTSGITCSKNETVSKEIKEAKENAETVIVFFHWGDEYKYYPNSRQKELAKLSIDNGADLVIGNHPHWYQGVEIYKDKLIMYSHGNFIFDQMWSEQTKEGLVGKYTFSGNDLIDAEFIPIYITDYGIANIANPVKSKSILANFEKISLTQ